MSKIRKAPRFSVPLGTLVLSTGLGCSGSVDSDPANANSGVVAGAPGVVGAASPEAVPGTNVPAIAPVPATGTQPEAPVGGMLEPQATPGGVQPPADTPTGVGAGAPPTCVADQPLTRRVRPLSGVQYKNTILSVFPNAGDFADPYSVSDLSSRFSTGSEVRRFDFASTGLTLRNAENVAASVTDEAIDATPCLSEGAQRCVFDWVQELGARLYRKPVEDAHANGLVSLFEAATNLSDERAGVRAVLGAMLSSPRFLFRHELGELDPATGQYVLTPHETASALAYTLTDSPPDDALRASANAGMAPDELLRTHLPRLLESEAGRLGMISFVQELLAVRGYEFTQKNTELFPGFDDAARSRLVRDFRQTVDSMLSSEDPTFNQLMTGRTYVVAPETAALLGWDESQASPNGEAVIAPEPDRLGLLTHPVTLGVYAHQAESNPVSRGNLVSTKLLCVNVPPPPSDVEFPERVDDGMPRTLRQVLTEQHSVAACAGCHALMDPFGFPFEVFDAVGRLRDTDNGLPIDATGEIAGTGEIDGPVQDVSELLTKMASSKRAETCFSENAFKYVAGVGDEADLKCRVDRLAQLFSSQGGNVPELFSQILLSDEFLRRVDPSPAD